MALWLKESFAEHEKQRLMQKLLSQVEVFSGLTPHELMLLLERSEKFVFAAGDVILAEGSEGSYLYIILSGGVQVSLTGPHNQNMEVARLAPSDCFGEMSLVDHSGRSANVVATDSVVLLRIHESDCWKMPTVSAKVFRNIAYILSHRLREMNTMALWRR